MWAELDGDLDAAAAAAELMLARALIGEGLYQRVSELPPADDQIDTMLVALVDGRADRPTRLEEQLALCRVRFMRQLVQ